MSAGLDGDAAHLLAELVGHNVASLAHTTDSIIAITEAQRNDMAEAYIRLYDAIDRIPDMQRTTYMERQLSFGAHARDTAERYLHGDGVN